MSKLKIVKVTFDFYCFSFYHCVRKYISLIKGSFKALELKDFHFNEQFYKTSCA